MTVYVDQSGKVENTSKLTVVAYANGHTRSIRIGAREKQKLIRKKSYVFKIFAGLIFLLLKGQQIEEVKIDKEYPGHEPVIKNILLQLFQKFSAKAPGISFVLVGKSNLAHTVALKTFQRKVRPDLVAASGDILKLFYNKKELESLL